MEASLLRKVGRLDEALGFAQLAYANCPGYHTAIAVGLAHEAKGELAEWLEAYQTALRLAPDNVPARLDLADRLWHKLGLPQEARRWYQEVLDLKPDHPWGRPSYFALCHELEPDKGWDNLLRELAEEEPDNQRAQELLRRITPYFGALPEPTDATIDALRKLTADLERNPGALAAPCRATLTLSVLDAPSNRLALQMQMAQLGASLTIDYLVERLQEPDPREPRCPVDFVLWKYVDTTPLPAVPEPRPEVAELAAELARYEYDLHGWSQMGRRLASRLDGAGAVGDLLGAMVHPPPPPEGLRAYVWLQRVQIAAAFILAHVDAGWKDSARRRALFSLLLGPVDWTCGAAVLALTALALEDGESRAEVIPLFRSLLNTIPNPGHVCYAHALVYCYLRLPTRDDPERATLEQWVRGGESA
jgi:tetratricopeptide (TPR) repeat protein